MPRLPCLVVTGLSLAALQCAAQPADACHPPPPQQVTELFLSADCMACWQQPPASATPGNALRLDWVLPGAQGDDAPLAVAALAEAAERLASAATPDAPVTRTQSLPAVPRGLSLAVSSGLAWNGYLGLDFELNGTPLLPAGARGWVALVERVPAGQDGTPVARQLVRAVVGPLTLDPSPGTQRVEHLHAVRLPPNAQPARLAAVGWVDTADKRMLLAAQSLPADCTPP